MNVLFRESGQVPYIHLYLHEDPKKMNKSYLHMINDIKRHIKLKSAQENGGVARYIEAVEIHCGANLGSEGDAPHFVHKIPMLPTAPNDNMYFVVVMHRPDSWVGGPREPVKLLFAFRDLYLLGFLHGNQWNVFCDAKLGSDITLEEKLLWTVTLPFTGSYRDLDGDRSTLDLWFQGQSDTYGSLSSFNSQVNTKRGLLRSVLSIAEALRFPDLLIRISIGFAAGLHGATLPAWELYWPSLTPTTHQPRIPRIFKCPFDESHFTNWSDYCELAKLGPKAFIPIPGFATYSSLVSFLGVCLD
uniref:rRNA N-glycosylase n=1 Tax=Oryza brachyantha TaxID=4533 RepID=J3LCA2_ORYBR